MASPAAPSPPIHYRLWLHLLSGLLVLGTFVLVAVGGSVTSHGAGMAVPDWPGTFGYNMFLAPLDVWFRDPQTGQYFHGRFWEHSHRLIGSTVGLITIILAAALWVTQRRRPWLRWLGLTLLGMVIVQGLMGGFRVTENSQVLATIHGIFGQVVLATSVLAAAAVGRVWLGAAAAPNGKPGGAEGPGAGALFRWEIVVLPALVVLGLVLSVGLGGRHEPDNPGLIIWSVSDVGLVWVLCMGAFMGMCLWRLIEQARGAGGGGRGVSIPLRACLILLGLLLVQLTLGAAVRHTGAARAIPDAPLVYGGVLPPMTQRAFEMAVARLPEGVALPPPGTSLGLVWLHWSHRAWALLVVLAVVGVVVNVWRSRRWLDVPLVVPPLMLVLAVTFLQIMLGVMTVWSEIYPTMATYHQATGAALLGLTTWLAIRTGLASARPATSDYNPAHPPTASCQEQPA